ncbi:MAG TPA: hypothetical protein VNX25_02030 [Verrucomicrobiae bacterium]|nr:hypothetical protein [Verrucomicrobiae bacterium]
MEKDDKKREHLRLVVNNVEKRSGRPAATPEDPYIPVEELALRRETLRPLFYDGIVPLHAKAYEAVERFLSARGLPYGLDPHHGRVVVLPAVAVCPDEGEFGNEQDEALIFAADDVTGSGLCLSVEMVIPFFDDDPVVMEEALLYSPILQYGAVFLEENRQDGLLDLIYRVSFPLYPPAPTPRVLSKLLAVAEHEIREVLRSLFEYDEK